jgi:asparagine synthase (glutamine-hydrolysing)
MSSATSACTGDDRAAPPGWYAWIGGEAGHWPLSLHQYGTWPDGTFRYFAGEGWQLWLLGHSLLGSAQILKEVPAALRSSDTGIIESWPGSFTALLGSGGNLTVLADLAGQFPVYHGEHDADLLIGSDPRKLATMLGEPVDPLTLAARIACPEVSPLWSRRSPFERVGRLEGGDVLRASGRELVIDRHRPTSRLTAPEAARALRVALDDGVKRRCARQQVSSDFSGGLDSASIAFLASRHSDLTVPALTYHQPLAPAGDLADAQRLSMLSPRLRLTVVLGSEKTLPYQRIKGTDDDGGGDASQIWSSAEPSPGSLSASSTELRLTRAVELNARLHLTGEGGDALLTSAPSYLADLATPKSIGTLMRHCAAYGQLRYTSPARLAVNAVRLAHTDAASALKATAAALEGSGRGQQSWPDLVAWWSPSGEAMPWLTGRMRRHLAEVAADPLTAQVISPGLGPADAAVRTALRNSADAQRVVMETGWRLGLDVHAPMLDNAVIRAALSISPSVHADPHAYKPLLSAAMAGLVPGEVFDRQSKGNYAGEDYAGARRSAAAIRGLMQDSRLAALGIIEPAAVQVSLDKMIAGISVSLGPLNMLIATELWLRRLR